jgi:predicted transcriptional regulator YdeE
MKIAGLKIRTSNKNAMENQTIAAAWNDFFEQEIFLQIEQRLDQNIY